MTVVVANESNKQERVSKVKCAITATGRDLSASVDPRFGRCRYFIIVDTEDMSSEVVENENTEAGRGAGVQSGQLLADRDVSAVLTGNCGPNAHRVLSAAGIDIYTGVSGTVQEALDSFRNGDLATSESPNVAGHFGMQ